MVPDDEGTARSVLRVAVVGDDVASALGAAAGHVWSDVHDGRVVWNDASSLPSHAPGQEHWDWAVAEAQSVLGPGLSGVARSEIRFDAKVWRQLNLLLGAEDLRALGALGTDVRLSFVPATAPGAAPRAESWAVASATVAQLNGLSDLAFADLARSFTAASGGSVRSTRAGLNLWSADPPGGTAAPRREGIDWAVDAIKRALEPYAGVPDGCYAKVMHSFDLPRSETRYSSEWMHGVGTLGIDLWLNVVE